MSRPSRSVTALAAALLLAAGSGQALAAWNEATDGDFSNDGMAPTVVSLGLGSNLIWGTTGRPAPAAAVDLDYFTFTIPAGYQLSEMWVLDGTDAVGGGSFIGLMSGTQFTVPPSTPSAAGLLGWALFSSSTAETDLLPVLGSSGMGATGFTPPLPAGDYVFWVQETAVGVATYGFDLTVTAVPEAPSALAMLGGLALLASALRRR